MTKVGKKGKKRLSKKQARKILSQLGAGVFQGSRRQRGSRSSTTKQKGGAFGAGIALGMLAPMMMGTLGKMMKVNINK